MLHRCNTTWGKHLNLINVCTNQITNSKGLKSQRSCKGGIHTSSLFHFWRTLQDRQPRIWFRLLVRSIPSPFNTLLSHLNNIVTTLLSYYHKVVCTLSSQSSKWLSSYPFWFFLKNLCLHLYMKLHLPSASQSSTSGSPSPPYHRLMHSSVRT